MKNVLRPVAIFVALYLVACVLVSVGLPSLLAWHQANCFSLSSSTCSLSAAFLGYWWLALVPFLFIATFVGNRVLSKRWAP